MGTVAGWVYAQHEARKLGTLKELDALTAIASAID